MVMYQTPSFSGFQFGLGYSFNADDNKTSETGFRTADNTRAITTGLRYVNGPLNVAFSYDQLNRSNAGKTDDTDTTARQYILGGSYDFEVVKLALAVSRTQNGWFAGPGVNGNSVLSKVASDEFTNTFRKDFKANSYLVGLSAPIGGASNVFGSWQMVDPKGDYAKDRDLKKMHVFSLGYTYDLSSVPTCTPTVRTRRTTPWSKT